MRLHISVNHCTSALLALQDVLVWLTAQPQVHWVSPRAKTRAANFFATGIGQSGSAATLDDAKLGLDQDAGTHPFWKAGRALFCFSLSKVQDLVMRHLATVLITIARQKRAIYLEYILPGALCTRALMHWYASVQPGCSWLQASAGDLTYRALTELLALGQPGHLCVTSAPLTMIACLPCRQTLRALGDRYQTLQFCKC